MSTTKKTFTTTYSNGAAVKAVYHPEPDPQFAYEDRIELSFLTEEKKVIGTRMTFSEAVVAIKLLASAMDAFLDDRSFNPKFDVPLEAGGR